MLSWFSDHLKIYTYNDSQRNLPTSDVLKSYKESDLIEIHGGAPGPLAHVLSQVGTDLFQDCVVISVIRNPVSQYESLWRSAKSRNSFLDLPLSVRRIKGPSFEDVYQEAFLSHPDDINDCFDLYVDYWTGSSSVHTAQQGDSILSNLDRAEYKNTMEMTLRNDRYLFRRNAQIRYICSSLGTTFLDRAGARTPNIYFLTTELLSASFAYLATELPGFRDATILSGLQHVQSSECVRAFSEYLDSKRVNESNVVSSATSRLNSLNSYKYMQLNNEDYSVWFNQSLHWSTLLRSYGVL